MASPSMHHISFEIQPELHPLYPAPAQIAPLLSSHSGYSPAQKATLVSHCLTRACTFADLQLLQYLLYNSQPQSYVDLNLHDEDGVVLASVVILGFGAESDRDVEREECVRLLIAEGADMNFPDQSGWTPLHYASLLAPPTLVSHLLNHGCSPLVTTRRGLTALDIVTAYSVIPGREDVAFFLEEAMRGEGWQGNKLVERRQSLDRRIQQNDKQRNVREGICRMLELNNHWWGYNNQDESSIEDSEDESDEADDHIYTPPADYTSMLVFSPTSLPSILDSLITNFPPSNRNSEPANALYMLARFACLTCDDTWLEELIIGATDTIEETFFSRPDDLTSLIFWLHNTTVWLHLMRCDDAINEMCEILGSFILIEEVINSVFVFLIRFAERQIDKHMDTVLLDHNPLAPEFESVQFESEWSFFRSPFSGRKLKKSAPPQSITPSSTATSLQSLGPPSPASSSRPNSPSPAQNGPPPSTPKAFSSLRQSVTRARAQSSTTPLQSLFSESQLQEHSPEDITSFLTALHTLLTDAGINPVFITQLWSQVMYWTSCELFNRILTRKRHLCRSRALQIGMNLSALEEWVGNMGLPRGVESHFAPARELLHWLQCLSSMDDFSGLIATIQTMKNINPLQMRRAVRDYRYEVNESRMSEDCGQYLAQLQKDWERQRVKLGVEALRKEIGDRDRDRDDSVSSLGNDTSGHDLSISVSSQESSAAQRSIDMLFDRTRDKSEWMPAHAPEVLGELLDSRYMLPLLFPSDPRLLSAKPGSVLQREREKDKRGSWQRHVTENGRSASRASVRCRGTMAWSSRSKGLRQVRLEILEWIDGERAVGRWARQPTEADEDHDGEDKPASHSDGEIGQNSQPRHFTPLNRKRSQRSRHGRTSTGGEAISPIDDQILEP